MNVSFKVIDANCCPKKATDGSLGYDIVAYDVNYIESITAEMIKTDKQLGIVDILSVDPISDKALIEPKEQIYVLDSLYRCLIHTGIELVDIEEGYEIKVRAKKSLALLEGIHVVDCPAIVNLNGKKIIALIVYNLGSRKKYIKRYDTIGQLTFQKIESPNITYLA